MTQLTHDPNKHETIPQIVIVGGGAGGLELAVRLGKNWANPIRRTLY